MCATPVGTFRRSFLRPLPLAICYSLIDVERSRQNADGRNHVAAFCVLRSEFYLFSNRRFPDPTVIFGPFRVRALVRVHWPRTGRFFLWRSTRYDPISINRRISREISRRKSPSTFEFR